MNPICNTVGTQLWHQKNIETITLQNFQNLQNLSLRKITFKKCHNPISCVQIQRMKNTEIPQHPKSTKLSLYAPNLAQPQIQYLFFPALHAKDEHSCNTRSVTHNILDIPLTKTNMHIWEKLY